MSDAPVTLFIPFGSGYGNPGLTLRADTPKELNAILDTLSESDDSIQGEVSLLDDLLSQVETVKAAVLLKFPQEEKPAQRQASRTTVAPPSDAAPTCDHGPMKYREGISKAGNAYKAYFCPAPQGQVQCKPHFIK